MRIVPYPPHDSEPRRVLRPEWARCDECGCIRPRRGGHCMDCGFPMLPMLGRALSIDRRRLVS